MSRTIAEEIRAILGTHGRLSGDVATLEDTTDLYQAGLTSHATVNLMLALEEHFDVEFPERFLRRGAFASIAAIHAAIEELVGARA